MILGQADGHYKSLALKGCSPGEVSRSSDDEEAAFVRSLRGQEKSTNHARRHSRLPDPRKREGLVLKQRPRPKPQCTGQGLWRLPLPPGKAQAACCRLCVAPRTLSFKSSSGMRGLVSNVLP